MKSKVTAKKVSFCSEPYYPPGYCGYNPQFLFRFGETYGKTTYRLLTDPNVPKSNRTVLSEIYPDVKDQTGTKPVKNEWMRLRKESWGDKKLSDKMVPGYTGYIPKMEEHFGNRYAEVCRQATRDFAGDMNSHIEKRKELRPNTPMPPIRAEALPYVSLNEVHHSVSPYFMNINDPGKTFMSGYTGFIPRARAKFATVYPRLTREALIDFTQSQQQMKQRGDKPVKLQRPPYLRPEPKQEIYTHDGLLPSYTGYLPGHKFRFGATFGSSSRYFHDASKSLILSKA